MQPITRYRAIQHLPVGQDRQNFDFILPAGVLVAIPLVQVAVFPGRTSSMRFHLGPRACSKPRNISSSSWLQNTFVFGGCWDWGLLLFLFLGGGFDIGVTGTDTGTGTGTDVVTGTGTGVVTGTGTGTGTGVVTGTGTISTSTLTISGSMSTGASPSPSPLLPFIWLSLIPVLWVLVVAFVFVGNAGTGTDAGLVL